jgi:UDP-glucose 4,6-dehydratase
MDLYQPKNILITGCYGFIGSAVTILLVKKYPEINIFGLDKLDYCSDLDNLSILNGLPNFKFIKGDISSSDLVNYILSNENIDTIMHFAANSHVDSSFGNSFNFTMNNIMGTHVLLESAKNHSKIKKFIHVSTDEVYDYLNEDDIPRNETDKLGPTNPYAATKSAAEQIVKAYYHSFQLPIIITRGNNVYGPRCYPEKVIPKFINQILSDVPLTIHGNGNNMRNYLFVEDVARAFELILFKGIIGEIYNIGGTNEFKNIDIANQLIKHFNKGSIKFIEDRNFNDRRYHINSNKLYELGWKEEVSWSTGLNNTIEWYCQNKSRYSNIDF